MKTLLILLRVLGLLLAVVPALLYCAGALDLPQTKHLLLASAFFWFPAALLSRRAGPPPN